MNEPYKLLKTAISCNVIIVCSKPSWYKLSNKIVNKRSERIKKNWLNLRKLIWTSSWVPILKLNTSMVLSWSGHHASIRKFVIFCVLKNDLISASKKDNSTQKPTLEWCALNSEQILTSRQLNFKIRRSNNLKVGLNALACRLFILNDMIPLQWFNKSFDTFKVNCKKLMLS